MPFPVPVTSTSASSSTSQLDHYTNLINGTIPIAFLNSLNTFPSSYPSYPLDALDLQSLPSLMSPDHSIKDHHSDSFDDDEDMDAYDIFASPTHGQSRLNPSRFADQSLQQQQQQHRQQQYYHFVLLQQQQQQLQYNNSSSSNNQMQSFPSLEDSAYVEEAKPKSPLQILRPNHPMVLQRTLSMPSLHQFFLNPLLPRQQQQELPQQSSQPLADSFASPLDQQSLSSAPVYSSSSSISSSPAYHVPGAARFAPLSEALIDPLDHYLASFQSQRPILENTIPAQDQDMDLMRLSSLILSPTEQDDATSVYSAPASNSLYPSNLSWASSPNSRECSPGLSPSTAALQDSFSSSSSSSSSLYNVTPRTHPSTSLQFNSLTASAPASVSCASAPTLASVTPTATTPKRRKRVRPPTVKKPKKIRPTSFPCVELGCGKVFTRAYNLTSHMKTHSSEKPFLCGTCPLAFARRHDLERHIRLHTGEKPYSCAICEAGFMRNDALLRHQKLCGLAGSSFAPIMDGRYLDDERDGRAMDEEEEEEDDEEMVVVDRMSGNTPLL
ncbi:MAG: hypothetical protein J3R72DRAFT_444862 [Linnemannia gamsii]|nr:MAG: hypothetical protein J3R72DRAFT_444862 [Linnemannia gamsii]